MVVEISGQVAIELAHGGAAPAVTLDNAAQYPGDDAENKGKRERSQDEVGQHQPEGA